MADEGVYPKTDGDILYASEVNSYKNAVRNYTQGNGFWFGDNLLDVNPIDNTIIEMFNGATAGSVTNLTHDTDVDEYYSVTNGAYELVTDLYQTEDSCSKCYTYFDYSIYKELTETDLTSSITGVGNDTDTSAADILNIKSCIMYFELNGHETGGGSTANARVRITDGSNYANIVSLSTSNESDFTGQGIIKLYNDTTNDKIKAAVYYQYTRGASIFTGTDFSNISQIVEIDYSGWSASNLYINTYCSTAAGGDTADATVYYQRAYQQNPSTTATISVSSDSGSTYDECENGTVTDFTSSGSNIKAKIAGTLAADEGITIKKVIIRPEA